MPYYEFTEEEKQALREKYLADMAAINSYLNHPDHPGHQYKVDMAAFEKKINDPNEVYLYRKGLEFVQRQNKQKEIQEALQKKFEHLKIPGKLYPLNRFLHTDFIPSDDPEAVAYNEAKIQMYYLHPEAYVQSRFQRFLNTDCKPLADIGKCDDTKGLIQTWGFNHFGEMEDSFEFFNVMNYYPKEMLSPAMQKYHGSLDRNFETMMDPSDYCKSINDGYLYMPKSITQPQSFLIEGTDFFVEKPELYDRLMRNTSLGATLEIKPKLFRDFYKKAEKLGVDLKDPSFLIKNIMKVEGGKEPYCTINAVATNALERGKPSLYKIPDAEVADIKKLFNKDYTKEEGFVEPEMPEKFKPHGWRVARSELAFKYAVKYNLKIGEVENNGFGQLSAAIKGGPSERFFGTTSLEWKHLMQTMKDFDNPNHVAYQNSMPSKIAANQYLIHKGVKSLDDINRLSGTAKERAQLAWDVIDTFQKYDDPKSPKIVPGTNEVINKPERWPAIEDEAALGDDFVLVEKDGHELGKAKEVPELSSKDKDEFKLLKDEEAEDKLNKSADEIAPKEMNLD